MGPRAGARKAGQRSRLVCGHAVRLITAAWLLVHWPEAAPLAGAAADHGLARVEDGPARDVAALLQLKALLPGFDSEMARLNATVKGWTEQGSPQSACDWSFTLCDLATGRVQFLVVDLGQVPHSPCEVYRPGPSFCLLNLGGTLSSLTPALEALTRLDTLQLAGLGLTGTLPSEWVVEQGLLSRLVVLNLGFNSLTGSLPAAWSVPLPAPQQPERQDASTSLQHMLAPTCRPMIDLNLQSNRLTGTLPAGMLARGALCRLSTLYLDHNALSGPLPAEWLVEFAWPNTSSFGRSGMLSLSHNPLGGRLPEPSPDSLAAAAALGAAQAHLDASSTGQQRSLFVPSLAELMLRNCSLQGTLPDSWARLPTLRGLVLLDVSSNQLTGPLPISWLGGTSQTAHFTPRLRLSGNQLSGRLTLGPRAQRHDNIALLPGNEGICLSGEHRGAGAPDEGLRRNIVALCCPPFQGWCKVHASLSSHAAAADVDSGTARTSADADAPTLVRAVPLSTMCEEVPAAVPECRRQRSPFLPLLGAAAAATMAAVGGVVLGAKGRQPACLTIVSRARRSWSGAKRWLQRGGRGWLARQQRRRVSDSGRQLVSIAALEEDFAAREACCQGAAEGHDEVPAAEDIALLAASGRQRRGQARCQPAPGWLQETCPAGPAADDAGAAGNHGGGNGAASLSYGEAGAGCLGLELASLPGQAAAAQLRTGRSAPAALEPSGSWWLQSTSLRLQRRDIELCTDEDGELLLLGKGASAEVFAGQLHGTLPVAVKALRRGTGASRQQGSSGRTSNGLVGGAHARDMQAAGAAAQQQEGLTLHAQFWREAAVLRRCRHPNIVQLLGVYSGKGGEAGQRAHQGEAAARGASREADDGAAGMEEGSLGESSLGGPPSERPRLLLVVTELLLGGSLLEHLPESELRWHRRGAQVLLDVARALAFLHDGLRVVHFDVKSANVLLSAGGGSAKLADVGLARMLDEGALRPGGGTPVYAAPEQFLGLACGPPADVFAFGWLLQEVVTGQPLQRRGNRAVLRPPDDCPASIVQLIEQCLQVEAEQRPTAADLVRQIQQSMLEDV